MRESSISVCPVPTEQQPLNEYQQLRESWLFGWATKSRWEYSRKLFWVWTWGWVICGPIAAASFTPSKYPLQFAISGAAGALILVVLVLLRIYLGWWYIRDRLAKETVFYEESGWYDGQTWRKPAATIARDRLIVSYEIQPIMARLMVTFAIIASSIGIGTLIWWLFA